LGYESGFEVLRRWRSDRKLSGIQIVVWTQMGDREQEICRLFGLKHVISKWAGAAELQDAIKAAMQSPSSPSASK
jgi:CheY-like chemotaxis protein